MKLTSFFKNLNKTYHRLCVTERFIVWIGIGIAIIGILAMAANIYTNTTFHAPEHGGEFKEALIGSPRFINPILAETETDKALSRLIYASLFKRDKNGTPVKELAQSYVVSKDGKKYTVLLKDNLYFHDGVRLTADDVIFTINKIKDPLIKSPLLGFWEDVEVSKIANDTIEFKLKEPYSAFLDTLTFGILPKHLWETVDPNMFALHALNTNPVGAGPYSLVKIQRNKQQIPTSYVFKKFDKYALGSPYIGKVYTLFTQNEQDALDLLASARVDAFASISPSNTDKLADTQVPVSLHTADTQRVFYLFLNHTKNKTLLDKNIRQAIYQMVDRDKIVNQVLKGYATPSYSVLPFVSNSKPDFANKDVQQLLKKAGYTFSTTTKTWVNKKEEALKFKLYSPDSPELKQVAEIIKQEFEKNHIPVTMHAFELNQLSQNIIRPREYEILLFGQVVNNEAELFSFWHSSQKDDPGLNIAMYANNKIDKKLQQLKTATSTQEVKKLSKQINQSLTEELAAIPIYSPKFLYAVNSAVKNVDIKLIKDNADRFNGIHKFYIYTQRLWNFLKEN